VTSVNDILDFWFPAETRPGPSRPDGADNSAWFRPPPGFDDEVRRRFLAAYEDAAAGGLDGWAATADGALALVVLLDQMPRNMFRGQARSFATDDKALAVAREAVERGFDREIPAAWRKFFYLPFEHCEDRAMQALSVALFAAAGDKEGLRWAEMHKAIVDRFGRFPHRNAILERPSTPEETAWLKEGGETFGTAG
jgi:uncharacterized protein (DUF924 family)